MRIHNARERERTRVCVYHHILNTYDDNLLDNFCILYCILLLSISAFINILLLLLLWWWHDVALQSLAYFKFYHLVLVSFSLFLCILFLLLLLFFLKILSKKHIESWLSFI